MAINPFVVQKKLHFAALAHLVVRGRMAQGQTITYKELHDEIGSPWRWHGNEFAEMLSLIGVLDPEASLAIVTKATGEPAVEAIAWAELVASFDSEVKPALN